MCSHIADFLHLDSPTSDGLSPPPSPHPLDLGVSSKPRRNVRFCEVRTEVSIESLACLSDAEKDKLWFTDVEIESFKARARALCEDIRLGVTNEDNTRGLELRLCQERQRRKYMILQAILRAQKRYKDPQQLCNIARKCSVWSKTVAAISGQRDYITLYEPTRIASIPSFPPLANYPLPFRAKEPCKVPVKRPTSPVPHGRRVRPRPAPFATATPC